MWVVVFYGIYILYLEKMLTARLYASQIECSELHDVIQERRNINAH
jgi:hypothetical protein